MLDLSARPDHLGLVSKSGSDSSLSVFAFFVFALVGDSRIYLVPLAFSISIALGTVSKSHCDSNSS